MITQIKKQITQIVSQGCVTEQLICVILPLNLWNRF